jgi:hypothetical protein
MYKMIIKIEKLKEQKKKRKKNINKYLGYLNKKGI